MSFKRTVAEVESLATSVTSLSLSNDPINDQKATLTSLQTTLSNLQPAVQKFMDRVVAGEKDPNKRFYGPTMVTKIQNLCGSVASVEKDLAACAEIIDLKYDEYMADERKKEDERKAAEEKERLAREEEERKRKEEEERLEEERLKKEAEERKKMEEEEQLAKRKLEEEARKNAELEALERKKRELEEASAAKKREEEAAAAVAASATKKAEEDRKKSVSIQITIKTATGKAMSLSDVPPGCSVKDLKQLIAKQHNISESSQRLIFQGRLLSDVKNISDYRIVNASAVHLVEHKKPSSASGVSIPGPPKPLVPPGTVCHITNGKEQFDQIASNCGRQRLMVVDWSAPWCGPCRMIAPVFERLANRFSDVTFVKVDTEASPANSFLASEKGIQAYPTFHFYINSQMVHSFAGARATDIESNVTKYRAQMISQAESGSSSASPPVAGPSGELTRRVFTALTTLRDNCSQPDFIIAVRTLLTFVRNVVDNPTQEKYRKVRTGNNTFQTRLASKTGGMDCMRAFGFQETTEGGVAFLSMSAAAAQNPELRTVKAQLEQALSGASGASGPPTTPTRSTTPGVTANPPMPSGGFPGMMGGEMPNMDNEMYQSMYRDMMANPEFLQLANELASDPSAVETMMQLQTAMQTGDTAAIERLRTDPSFARLHAAITSNPAVLNSLMRRMGDGGFPNMGGMPGMGGFGGMGMGGNTGGDAGNGGAPMPPPYPGAPTSAEEEERLLQEAIRLSMQDQNRSSESRNDGDGEKKDGEGQK